MENNCEILVCKVTRTHTSCSTLFSLYIGTKYRVGTHARGKT